jgi:hypothetical protein
MASELSTYLANAHLAWLKGDDMPAAPTTVYVAIFNGDPTAAGTGGTEVSGTISDGRKAVSFGTVTARAVANDANIDFGAAAASGTITHGALFDAATGGNMLYFTPLTNTRTIALGDPVVIPAGDLNVNYN